MKNDSSQQIILSVSQPQPLLSQSKVYTLPSNFILNQHASFITPSNDLVGNMKYEAQ